MVSISVKKWVDDERRKLDHERGVVNPQTENLREALAWEIEQLLGWVGAGGIVARLFVGAAPDVEIKHNFVGAALVIKIKCQLVGVASTVKTKGQLVGAAPAVDIEHQLVGAAPAVDIEKHLHH